MRRLTAMITATLLLLMTSCAPQVVAPVTSGFSCDVAVVYDDATYRGTLEVHEGARIVLVLHEPPTVAGLTLSFAEEQLTVALGGMELKLTETQVPAGAVVRLFAKAFDTAAASAQTAPSCEIQGVFDATAYTLKFDAESGLPLTLSVPSYALTVTFSDWEIIQT